MSYFDLSFAFLFLPIVVIIYNIIPKKFRYIVLLIASIVFFLTISNWLIIFLVLSVISIYFGSNYLEKLDDQCNNLIENKEKDEKKAIKLKFKRRKKKVLLLVLLFNIAFLFSFKYLRFFLTNTNIILDFLHVDYSFKILKFAAPIGISFYTLQAISYMVDVYNNKVDAQKNILKLGLYLSFFPTIMEGPIARYGDMAQTLYEGTKVNFKNFCFGYQRIFYGFFKKFVIADRLNILVKLVFDDYMSYSGTVNFLAVVAYTIMLYAEFSGTMDLVIGTGEIFGIKVPENFRQPFFAKNISEFWTRWHISLGTWFKDYIFYPISLCKPMKKITIYARRFLGNHFGPLVSGSVALLVVWLLNGLWHGAGWNYIFFGLYHFVMILFGNIFEPFVVKMCGKLKINRKNIIYRVMQSVKLTFLVFIGELFFRAPSLEVAFGMLKKIFSDVFISSKELLSIGLDIQDYWILLIALLFIFIIGILKENNKNIREWIEAQKIFIRWPLYYALIFSILIFGAYGPGYAPVDPIYADF